MAQRKLHIPLPDKYLPHVGEEPSLKWNIWETQMADFFTLTNSTLAAPLTDVDKNRYLRSLLGSEGLRLFHAHPLAAAAETTTFVDYLAAAKEVFGRPVNAIRAHYEFNTRKQGPHETVKEYVLALRTLMTDCDFHGQGDYHLSIQLATGCRNKEAQQKLLCETEINFVAFRNILEANESSSQDTHLIRGEAQISYVKNKKKSQPQRPPVNKFQSTDRQKSSPKSCFGCGATDHLFRDKNCQAYGHRCEICNATDHFSSFCRKNKKGQNKSSQSRSAPTLRTKTLHMAPSDATIKSVYGSHDLDHFQCSLQIEAADGKMVNLVAGADTQSDLTGITESFYKSNFSSSQLQPPTGKITNFDHSEIEGITGYFPAKAHFESRSADIKIHVLPDHFGSVIGRDAILGLKMQLDGSTGSIAQVSAMPASSKSDTIPLDYSKMLHKFPRLTDPEIGLVPDFAHKIELDPDAIPKVQKLRSIPLSRRDGAIKEIDLMEKQGIWSKVDRANWVHGLVTVDKPGGAVRITTDLSPLNKYVVPVRYPLPNIRDMYLKLQKAKYYTKLDMQKYFYNIAIHPDSRHLTTTITPKGLYAYNRLPMGLVDSPAVSQQVVSKVLADTPGCEPYIDDIIVYGMTRHEHDINLDQVLQKLHDANLRLNVKKCVFGVTEVQFLGHIVSQGSLKPDPKNLQPIRDATTPTTLTEVQSFLGMINYYNEFLPDLAAITEPLRELTRNGVPFDMTADRQKSFETLKKMVCTELKLAIFDPESHTIVTTDASNVGIGGVLSQLQNCREVPVAFGHHTLDSRQRGYDTTEKETLAAVYFPEYWEKFLLGRHFTLRTDHQALTTLLRSYGKGRKAGKFARWFERLSNFNYTIEFRRGKDNKVADALSRLHMKASELGVPDYTVSKMISTVTEHGLSFHIFGNLTQDDPVLKQVYCAVSSHWPHKNKISPELVPYYQVRNELSLEGLCIVRDSSRIVVPASLQARLLQMAHVGHPGIVRMKRKLRESYWWPGQDKEIEHFVKICSPCQDSAKSAPKLHIPPQRIDLPEKPWQKVAIDITGPFSTAPTHQRFIVVLIDYFSSFPEILCTNDITSGRIIKWFKEVFARYGNPDRLVSDNGPQFDSGEFSDFLRSRDIFHERTPVYHPQQNGLVEVFNRYLKHGIVQNNKSLSMV